MPLSSNVFKNITDCLESSWKRAPHYVRNVTSLYRSENYLQSTLQINYVCVVQRPNSVAFQRYLGLTEGSSWRGYDVTRICITHKFKQNLEQREREREREGGLKLHFHKHKHIVTINNSNRSRKGNKQQKQQYNWQPRQISDRLNDRS